MNVKSRPIGCAYCDLMLSITSIYFQYENRKKSLPDILIRKFIKLLLSEFNPAAVYNTKIDVLFIPTNLIKARFDHSDFNSHTCGAVYFSRWRLVSLKTIKFLICHLQIVHRTLTSNDLELSVIILNFRSTF